MSTSTGSDQGGVSSHMPRSVADAGPGFPLPAVVGIHYLA